MNSCLYLSLSNNVRHWHICFALIICGINTAPTTRKQVRPMDKGTWNSLLVFICIAITQQNTGTIRFVYQRLKSVSNITASRCAVRFGLYTDVSRIHFQRKFGFPFFAHGICCADWPQIINFKLEWRVHKWWV